MSQTTAVAVPTPPITAAEPTSTSRVRGPKLSDKVQSGVLRAARTFTHSFIAVLTASPMLNLNIPTLKAAGAAGLAAVLALVQRWLDETSVPTIPKG